METVQIKDVKTNSRGWTEITLEGDDRVLATKDGNLTDAAKASIGAPVEVEVNTRTKGNFTNHYLASLGGVKEASRPRAAASEPARPSRGKSPEEQERIARQWAFGRATELLMASDTEFTFPLDERTFSALAQQASDLLAATKV